MNSPYSVSVADYLLILGQSVQMTVGGGNANIPDDISMGSFGGQDWGSQCSMSNLGKLYMVVAKKCLYVLLILRKMYVTCHSYLIPCHAGNRF